MKVLLLGGTGQISTGIVKALQSRGAAITVFNRGQTDNRLGPGVRSSPATAMTSPPSSAPWPPPAPGTS
jgi:uncharacterized protein YbjT (DUF2867 family)